MSDKPNLACANEARRIFFERVGRYFYEPNPSSTATHCKICGATDVILENDKKKPGPGSCLAQRSITSKRHAPINGAIPFYGVELNEPNKKGMNAFIENSFALIETDKSFVACNIAPILPLPNNMTTARSGNEERRAIFRRLLDKPPKGPYLLVEFSRAAEFPMRMSLSPNYVWWCKTPMPIGIDLAILTKTVKFFQQQYAATEALEPKRRNEHLRSIFNLIHLRDEIAAGAPNASQRLAAIFDATPELALIFETLPSASAPETILARDLTRPITKTNKTTFAKKEKNV